MKFSRSNCKTRIEMRGDWFRILNSRIQFIYYRISVDLSLINYQSALLDVQRRLWNRTSMSSDFRCTLVVAKQQGNICPRVNPIEEGKINTAISSWMTTFRMSYCIIDVTTAFWLPISPSIIDKLL